MVQELRPELPPGLDGRGPRHVRRLIHCDGASTSTAYAYAAGTGRTRWQRTFTDPSGEDLTATISNDRRVVGLSGIGSGAHPVRSLLLDTETGTQLFSTPRRVAWTGAQGILNGPDGLAVYQTSTGTTVPIRPLPPAEAASCVEEHDLRPYQAVWMSDVILCPTHPQRTSFTLTVVTPPSLQPAQQLTVPLSPPSMPDDIGIQLIGMPGTAVAFVQGSRIVTALA